MESLAAHRVRAHMTHRLFRVNSQMSRILIIIGLVILGIGLL